MLTGHSSPVAAMAFSPDGKQIASGSEDETIKRWDVAESLKSLGWLGSTFGRHIKFRAWQGIKMSKPVHMADTLRQILGTSRSKGSSQMEKVPTSRRSSIFALASGGFIMERRLCCDCHQILRLDVMI
jgi:WD40 repeat protein